METSKEIPGQEIQVNLYSVAYLGYGRHGTCHGRHFDEGAKIVWQKLKCVTYTFVNLHLAAHATIQQQRSINTVPSCITGQVVPAPSISVS